MYDDSQSWSKASHLDSSPYENHGSSEVAQRSLWFTQRSSPFYPLVMTNSLLLNMAHIQWVFPLKMVISVIFHSYVSYVNLPDGNSHKFTSQPPFIQNFPYVLMMCFPTPRCCPSGKEEWNGVHHAVAIRYLLYGSIE